MTTSIGINQAKATGTGDAMRVLVCGGRNYKDREHVEWVLAKAGATLIIEPGTLGAPYLAAEWARRKNFPVKTYRMDPLRYGAEAGAVRNQQMIDEGPDIIIVFPGDDIIADVLQRAHAAALEVLLADTISSPNPSEPDDDIPDNELAGNEPSSAPPPVTSC